MRACLALARPGGLGEEAADLLGRVDVGPPPLRLRHAEGIAGRHPVPAVLGAEREGEPADREQTVAALRR